VDIKSASTVLILSSDNLLLNKLINSLNTEGYHVESAQDTKQALEKIKAESINVILVDEAFFSNGSSDTKFILKLKSTYPQVPVVMMVTPETDNKSLIHAMLSSGNIEHCIFKPFLPQSLISLIINIITKSQRKLKRAEGTAIDDSAIQERRKFIRSDLPVDVVYFFIDKSQPTPVVVEREAKSVNISTEGVQLDIGVTKHIPKYMDMKLLIPSEESIHITGQVMWEKEKISEKSKLVGIHFVDMNPQTGQIIANYVTTG
jgi:DNA-binding response OmpR family regulator